ncbi:ribonuclease III [Planctobacterium marinum]|uniref:ribonuclease III n=1 Tax=Planctobacterium marinum TaxID=1631968 RepID=UPI001E28AB58|nr:ribonuclease III [Planctobacterium marinum]MCC2604750.1 ribonuclease III [Planctobacterium marinum]
MDDIRFNQLTKRIGYQFQDRSLLVQALTHRSAANEHNERLEYLGDSILGFIVAKYLYNRFPEQPEGKLTRMRSTLVKGETLATIARQMELGEVILLGPGELKSGGFSRDSILSDAVEALIGAIYLEAGMQQSEEVVLQWLHKKLEKLDPNYHPKDNKTRLQEYLQSKHLPLPEYEVTQIKGKSHNQRFFVSCKVQELNHLIEGEGASRRKAEQDAAQKVIRKLEIE